MTASTSFDPVDGSSSVAVAGRVLAAQEAVDDAILEADEARGAVVVLGEHAGDADQRQRALALPALRWQLMQATLPPVSCGASCGVSTKMR